ncbi:hypothetical protein RHMOL_Rhmol10G0284600 [Rhododendron molle]|uniref:Uncharacterized protein n=1 Tax=Rhododendron molle TaxID=49168 RepID=A0ACC0M768_RHOML|nr:hypothetical protein RHMOL_Rhmol10G0284600 [Rhododendron molle]
MNLWSDGRRVSDKAGRGWKVIEKSKGLMRRMGGLEERGWLQGHSAGAGGDDQTHQPKPIRSIRPISAVQSPDPSKPTTKSTAADTSTVAASTTTVLKKKWAMDSWKTKKALQLPEYPDRDQLQSVLETLEAFLPIAFAGEGRSLEERLGEAAMGMRFYCRVGIAPAVLGGGGVVFECLLKTEKAKMSSLQLMEYRKKSYKAGLDLEESSRQREEDLEKVRLSKREENLLNKRGEGRSSSSNLRSCSQMLRRPMMMKLGRWYNRLDLMLIFPYFEF